MRKPLYQLDESDVEASEAGHRWLDEVRGYVLDLREIDFTWNPALLAANTHVEESVTVSGLKVGDIILAVIKPTFMQGFQVGQGRVSAADTLGVQVVNGTAGNSDPDSETYKLIYIKNSRN